MARPYNLEGKPWGETTANMVLNRIKRDVAEKFLADEIAKGVLPGGRVIRWYDADGNEVKDYKKSTHVRVDPLLVAQRHGGRELKKVWRTLWWHFVQRPREEDVRAALHYSPDNPLGKREPFRIAEHVPWHEDELPMLHDMGLYLDWKPRNGVAKRGPGRPKGSGKKQEEIANVEAG